MSKQVHTLQQKGACSASSASLTDLSSSLSKQPLARALRGTWLQRPARGLLRTALLTRTVAVGGLLLVSLCCNKELGSTLLSLFCLLDNLVVRAIPPTGVCGSKEGAVRVLTEQTCYSHKVASSKSLLTLMSFGPGQRFKATVVV